MPPPPTFDYYVELELERSASSQEVISSFRRLAMIHHPDRNPDNQQEATARFQRLQLAYETLSDSAKRARYDNTHATPSSVFDFDDDDDVWDNGNDDVHDFFQTFGFGFPFGGSFAFSSGMPSNFGYSYGQSRYEDMDALRRFQEYHREILREERRRREEAEKARLRAHRAAKRDAELAKEAQKNDQYETEQKKQECRWTELNAVTKDERLAACLHSDFCRKIPQQKKFKCSACSVKRGLIAFECPYCSVLLCQLCITNFSDRRKKLDKSGGPSATATATATAPAQDTEDHYEDVDPANNHNATNETEATSTASPSSQKNTSRKKKKKANKANKKNKPEPAKAEATGTQPNSPHNSPAEKHTPGDHNNGNKEAPVTSGSVHLEANANKSPQTEPVIDTNQKTAQGGKPISTKLGTYETVPSSPQNLPSEDIAQDSPNKSNQKTTASAEPQGTTATPELSQQKKVATAADKASSPKTTIGPDVVTGKANNGEDDKAEAKSQDPAANPTPADQHKNPQSTTKPTPGTTRGFIRNTKPTQGAPEALLRQAMEQFGTVASLKTKNRYVGTAHVQFADHDGLCKAIAASPVVVTDHVAVNVVELKECSKCGRFGHVTAQCRFAKASGRRGRG